MNTKRMNSQAETPGQGNPLPDLSEKTIPALLALVDEAILKKAARGDVAAAKLCYQRFEGWSEPACVDMNIGMNHGSGVR